MISDSRYMKKLRLLNKGIELCKQFCENNNIPLSNNIRVIENGKLAGRYSPMRGIEICLKNCAYPITNKSQPRHWSFPGYKVDMTPYGVLAHEFGHYMDDVFKISKRIRNKTKAPKLTNYCPNTFEWFAEHFKLFLTNPDLHRRIAPKVFSELSNRFNLSTNKSCLEILEYFNAPTKILNLVTKKYM